MTQPKRKRTNKRKEKRNERNKTKGNKAGYTATKVAYGWVGAIFEVTRPFGQER